MQNILCILQATQAHKDLWVPLENVDRLAPLEREAAKANREREVNLAPLAPQGREENPAPQDPQDPLGQQGLKEPRERGERLACLEKEVHLENRANKV